MPDADVLKESTSKFIGAMTDILAASKDFVLEQAPDVLRQWVAWGFWSNAISATLLAVLGVAVWRMAVAPHVKRIREPVAGPCRYGYEICRRGPKEKEGPCFGDLCRVSPTDADFVVSVIAGTVAIVIMTIACCCATEALQVHVAPKVWLIKQFRDIAR